MKNHMLHEKKSFSNFRELIEWAGHEHGERVAQLAIVPFLKVDFEICDDLSDTLRGTGGFGSTGK